MVGRLVDCPFLRRLAGLLVLDGRLLLAGLPRRDRRLRLREVFARRVVVLAVDLVRRERQVPAVAEEPVVRPVGELRAGAAVRDGEKPHHAERDDEDRQREDLVRDDLVDPVRQGQRLRAALLRVAETFENVHAAAFRDDDTVAIRVERSRSLRRIFVASKRSLRVKRRKYAERVNTLGDAPRKR